MELIGRITKKAEIKKLKDDRTVVTFTIALNDFYKPKGIEKAVQSTTYVNCSYWISIRVAERLTKGTLVEISGRIYVNAYKGIDGEARASLNCHVNSIRVHHAGKNTNPPVKTSEAVATDLPF